MVKKSEEICTKEGCHFKGKPQPLKNFRKMAHSEKRLKICNSCMGKMISEGRAKTKMNPELKGERKKTDKAIKALFEGNEDLFSELTKTADCEFRTLKDQILFSIKQNLTKNINQ